MRRGPSWEATYMLALLRRGPQRLHAHPPPSPLCSLLPASSTEVGTRTAGTAPRRTLRHALSGEFIGFPGSCSSPARGAAQGGPRARAAEFKSAGPARRGAADGGRFRPAHNFPNTWGQGLRGVEPESSRVDGGSSLRGWNGATRRVQSL